MGSLSEEMTKIDRKKATASPKDQSTKLNSSEVREAEWLKIKSLPNNIITWSLINNMEVTCSGDSEKRKKVWTWCGSDVIKCL